MQAAGKEVMSQAEIDILMGTIQEEGSGSEAAPSRELKKRAAANYRQLELAMKRADISALGNVPPEDMADRLRNVHYYAHWNWLYNRGFASKEQFREFVRAEMEKRGMDIPPSFAK